MKKQNLLTIAHITQYQRLETLGHVFVVALPFMIRCEALNTERIQTKLNHEGDSLVSVLQVGAVNEKRVMVTAEK